MPLESQSNKTALKVLLTLVFTAVGIFFLEDKFLINEMRGQAVSHYNSIPWQDQILFLAEDFEGFKNTPGELQKENFFNYGNAKISLDSIGIDDHLTASKTCCRVNWIGEDKFGGWGKGIGKNIDLDAETDYLNFRILFPKSEIKSDVIKIILEEDDNEDGVLQKELDDSFAYTLNIKSSDKWQFISIPLKDFYDVNPGGDSLLNVTRKGGLHTLIFSFEQPTNYTASTRWYFDFICFTKGKINDPTIN